MENTSLPNDVWNNATESSYDSDDMAHVYLANIRDLALKVIYIMIGIVGVLDNLFVLIVFIVFIKIAGKVFKILNCILRNTFSLLNCSNPLIVFILH